MVGLSENGDQNAPRFGGKGKTVLLRGERHVGDDPLGMVVDRANLLSIEKDPRRRIDAVPCLGELDAQGIDGVGHEVSQEKIEGLNTCAVVLAPFQAYSSDREVKSPGGTAGIAGFQWAATASRAVNAFASQLASTLKSKADEQKETGSVLMLIKMWPK